MPLQNRITPQGNITATSARGSMMGNRGGRIHDPATRTLIKRRWASRQWIICVLEFKDRHRKVMGPGYTELFFLDEVTALAAGHRPCFECRRAAAEQFFAAHCVPRIRADAMDRILHAERLSPARAGTNPANAPDGAMFAVNDAQFARRGNHLLRWTPSGYDQAVPLAEITNAQPLTPPTTLGILAAGYQPVWHPTAHRLTSNQHEAL